MTSLVTETISVQYSDAPKSERGPWSIKDDKGRRFQGWPKALTRPEAGSTIVVHYKVGDYMGKPQYDIQKIGGDAPAAPASAPYREAPAAVPPPRGDKTNAWIFLQTYLKVCAEAKAEGFDPLTISGGCAAADVALAVYDHARAKIGG